MIFAKSLEAETIYITDLKIGWYIEHVHTKIIKRIVSIKGSWVELLEENSKEKEYLSTMGVKKAYRYA